MRPIPLFACGESQVSEPLRTILRTTDSKESLMLLVLALECFEEIRESMGSLQGEQLMEQVGTRLKQFARTWSEKAVWIRRGEDTFVFMLPGAREEQGPTVVQAIHRLLEEPFSLGALRIQMGGRSGVAYSPGQGTDGMTLMRCAEQALFLARGQQTGHAFSACDPKEAHWHHLAIMSALRQAIANRSLQLHYQPKIEIHTGIVHGVEALVRWHHPTYGSLPPDQFLPLVEQMGLMVPLSHWALESAIEQGQRWRNHGLELTIAVNISMENLYDTTLPHRIGTWLRDYGLPGRLLQVEIPEGAPMRDRERATRMLEQLRALGVGIALDDFGSGYSTFDYLTYLPLNELKLDRSLVQQMVKNAAAAVIVRSLVKLGHQLGLRVVAEGVEEWETWEALATSCCDDIQGYFLLPPVAPTAFEAWFRSHQPYFGNVKRSRNILIAEKET